MCQKQDDNAASERERILKHGYRYKKGVTPYTEEELRRERLLYEYERKQNTKTSAQSP